MMCPEADNPCPDSISPVKLNKDDMKNISPMMERNAKADEVQSPGLQTLDGPIFEQMGKDIQL